VTAHDGIISLLPRRTNTMIRRARARSLTLEMKLHGRKLYTGQSAVAISNRACSDNGRVGRLLVHNYCGRILIAAARAQRPLLKHIIATNLPYHCDRVEKITCDATNSLFWWLPSCVLYLSKKLFWRSKDDYLRIKKNCIQRFPCYSFASQKLVKLITRCLLFMYILNY